MPVKAIEWAIEAEGKGICSNATVAIYEFYRYATYQPALKLKCLVKQFTGHVHWRISGMLSSQRG